MRIGVFGGSFNPIHFGHIGLAQWIKDHTDIDEVWLMVSPNNPLKDPSQLADEKVRLEQVQKAIQGIDGLRASDFEFHLPKPNFTITTLQQLECCYPDHTFSLIIGQDNWEHWHEWHQADEILAHYPIIIYPRHGCEKELDKLPQTVLWLKNAPYFDISSTQIRNNLQEQKKITTFAASIKNV